MKKIIYKTIFLFLLFHAGNISASDTKDTIRIGIFIESLYDLDFADYSYNANFWMWSVAKGDLNNDGKINTADSLVSTR